MWSVHPQLLPPMRLRFLRRFLVREHVAICAFAQKYIFSCYEPDNDARGMRDQLWGVDSVLTVFGFQCTADDERFDVW
jgi:hypothetical protein